MTTAMKTGTESPELFVKHEDGGWHHNSRQVEVVIDTEHNTLLANGILYDIKAVEPYIVDEESGSTDLDYYCVKRTTVTTRQIFNDEPIPNGYAKVIDIGPEGETNSPRIMPADVACREWEQRRPEPNERVFIIAHPLGTTAIYWDANQQRGEVRGPDQF